MKKYLRLLNLIVFLLSLTGASNIYAQLSLQPDAIEFQNNFQRLKNILFINSGSDTVKIDSIYYNSKIYYNANLYLTRFNKEGQFPIIINPGDSLVMDCILAGYFAVTQQDQIDTMWVALHSQQPKPLKIQIDFYEPEYEQGKITGSVLDGVTPISNAEVLFFFNGNFLFRKTLTDTEGKFSVKLPPAEYTIAVEKTGYYTSYYNNTTDPLNATALELYNRDSIDINFSMTKPGSPGSPIFIAGKVSDNTSRSPIGSGIVVIRKGIHTPSKIVDNNSGDVFASLIRSDGTFKIDNVNPGTYYLQSFSGYYSPSYFNYSNLPENFWYNADSLIINQSLSNITIQMPRDSSFWGGVIDGSVTSNSNSFSFSDIIVYAYNVNILQDTVIYSYSIVNNAGKFSIKGLPYGNYKILGQKIGYPNAISSESFMITASTPKVQNAVVPYSVNNNKNNNTLPVTTQLYQNFPNPFNPSTSIKFYLTTGSNVILKVTNVLGQEIAVLKNGFLTAGFHNLDFNAQNLSSGIYFLSLITHDKVLVKKMMLLK